MPVCVCVCMHAPFHSAGAQVFKCKSPVNLGFKIQSGPHFWVESAGLPFVSILPQRLSQMGTLLILKSYES